MSGGYLRSKVETETSEPVGGRGQRPGRGKRWAYTLGALLLGCTAAEIAARIATPELHHRVGRHGSTKQGSQNPALRYENRRSTRAALVVFPADSEPQLVHLRLNSAGFRGPEIAREKEPGTLRIACLGDSHTFGHGVDEEAAWPGVLADGLRQLEPASGASFEVLNAGVGGYDIEQEAEWLSTRVLLFAPDVVLLQLHVNDAHLEGLGRRDDWLLDLTQPFRADAFGRLRHASRFLDVVCDRIYRRRGMREFARNLDELYSPGHASLERMEAALRRMHAELRGRGIRFAVGLFPYLALREGESELVSQRAFRELVAICERAGIPVFDPSERFLAADPATLRISTQDPHANARGHELFGTGFLRFARERGLFAPGARSPAGQAALEGATPTGE